MIFSAIGLTIGWSSMTGSSPRRCAATGSMMRRFGLFAVFRRCSSKACSASVSTGAPVQAQPSAEFDLWLRRQSMQPAPARGLLAVQHQQDSRSAANSGVTEMPSRLLAHCKGRPMGHPLPRYRPRLLETGERKRFRCQERLRTQIGVGLRANQDQRLDVVDSSTMGLSWSAQRHVSLGASILANQCARLRTAIG